MLEQKCKCCGKVKPMDEFYKTTDRKSGRTSQCKECMREKHKNNTKRKERMKQYGKDYHLNRRYGISVDKRNSMLKDQNHKCAICGIDEVETKTGVLYVDHDHSTGKVRQLLCFHCNTGLGHFKESEDTLLKTIQYLRKYKE